MANKTAAHLQSTLHAWLWRLIGMSLLLLSAYGWLRFVASLSQIKALLDFGLYPALPRYLQISGFIIGSLSLASWLLLKLGHPAGLKFSFAVVVAFLLVYWLERFFVWRNTQVFSNWPFMLGLSIFWLLLFWAGIRLVKSHKNNGSN